MIPLTLGTPELGEPCRAFCPKSISEVPGEWYAAQVRYEHGRLKVPEFLDDLRDMGIDFFYPQEVIRRCGKEVIRPVLAKPYVFFADPTPERYIRAEVRSRHNTQTVLNEPRQRRLRNSLIAIDLSIANGISLQPARFVEGTLWEVKPGHPLAGTRGSYQSFDKKRGILTITVELIGSASSLEISPEFVDPA